MGNSPHNEYFIIRNGDIVIAHGHNEANTALHTGQPILEVTQVYSDYVARCNELGVEPVEEVI